MRDQNQHMTTTQIQHNMIAVGATPTTAATPLDDSMHLTATMSTTYATRIHNTTATNSKQF